MTTPARESVWARYCNAFRLASYLMVLYAFGHTRGAVIGTPHFGAESDAVASMMKSVPVHVQGADCTWYGFYRGFGVMVSVYFVFSAALSWHLGGIPPRDRRAFAPIAWLLFLSYVANTLLAGVYFFAAPVVFSTVISTLLGLACIGVRRPLEQKTAAATA
jgi:hypothetical protein